MAEAIRLHTEVTGERPARLVHRPLLDRHRRPRLRDRRLRLDRRHLRRRPALLARARRAASSSSSPTRSTTNDMRFAAGRASTRRRLVHLPSDTFDTLCAEGEAGEPEDDVGRPALPPRRPPRPRRRPRPLPRLRAGPRPRLARHPRRDRRATGAPATPRRPSPRARPRSTATPSSPASAASSSTRPGSPSAPTTSSSAPPTTPRPACTRALARVFRSASPDERLGVLEAHPDLAGKLAAAKRLTPESTAEQAGAGLDALTDAERARFTALNDAYQARFGFPFIIAVRGLDKAAILAAFEARLANDRAAEFAAACAQVERIALLRLRDLLESHPPEATS